ncbi:hypothetical protein R83H12_01246 [Fibrobacteria bacterium R8-3-H12]
MGNIVKRRRGVGKIKKGQNRYRIYKIDTLSFWEIINIY